MSPSRTGPLTFRMIDRFGSSMNSTRTWVTLPVLPVRPSTRLIFANLIGAVSMVITRESRNGVLRRGAEGKRAVRVATHTLARALTSSAAGPAASLQLFCGRHARAALLSLGNSRMRGPLESSPWLLHRHAGHAREGG